MNTSSADISQLPDALQTRIKNGVDANETIVWLGQPISEWRVTYAIPLVFFGFLFMATTLRWLADILPISVLTRELTNPAALLPMLIRSLCGLPFLLISIALLTAPYWVTRLNKNTGYVLTKKRAIVFDGGPLKKVQSFNLSQLPSLEYTQRANGSGDLIFDKSTKFRRGGFRTINHGFLGINNVQAVERLVRQLIEKKPIAEIL